MAYETGSASGPNDLLDKLRAFLLANSWTINSFTTIGSGRRLHVEKSGIFCNFRSYQNETLSNANDVNGESSTNFWGIGFGASDGYNGANSWSRQPGYPNYTSQSKGGYLNRLSSAIPTYHFFTYTDIDEVHVVLEFVTGRFQYVGFGRIARYNTSAAGGYWLGGGAYNNNSLPHASGIDAGAGAASIIPFRESYYSSSDACCSTFIRVDIDNHNGWAGAGRQASSSPSPIAAMSSQYWDGNTESFTTSPYTWQTQLLPYMIGIIRSDAAISPFGEIKHLRRLDITNYLPAEEFTLGPDTWKVFPLYQKGGYSFNRGFAVRKVS